MTREVTVSELDKIADYFTASDLVRLIGIDSTDITSLFFDEIEAVLDELLEIIEHGETVSDRKPSQRGHPPTG